MKQYDFGNYNIEEMYIEIMDIKGEIAKLVEQLIEIKNKIDNKKETEIMNDSNKGEQQ